MKFKSLFRRGQPSQQQQQQSAQQQQQQPTSLRQAPSASSLEAKSEILPAGNNWTGSLSGKESARTNAKTTTAAAAAAAHQPKGGPAKAARMQELEREIEVLRKDRVRLEANLRDAACDAQNLRELRAELAVLKVSRSAREFDVSLVIMGKLTNDFSLPTSRSDSPFLRDFF